MNGLPEDLRDILCRSAARECQRVTPDEAEAWVRDALRDDIDDLHVAWQVAQARARCSIGLVYMTCAPVPCCEGPETRQVHDERRRRADFGGLVLTGIERARALRVR